MFQQSKGSELVQHTCDVDSDHPEDKESPWPFAQLRRPEPGRGNIGNRDEEQCDASNGDDDDDGGEDDDDGHGPGNSNPAHSASTESLDCHDNLRQLIPLMTMVLT